MDNESLKAHIYRKATPWWLNIPLNYCMFGWLMGGLAFSVYDTIQYYTPHTHMLSPTIAWFVYFAGFALISLIGLPMLGFSRAGFYSKIGYLYAFLAVIALAWTGVWNINHVTHGGVLTIVGIIIGWGLPIALIYGLATQRKRTARAQERAQMVDMASGDQELRREILAVAQSGSIRITHGDATYRMRVQKICEEEGIIFEG